MYRHNKAPRHTLQRILWCIVAVLCGIELAGMAYLCTNHAPKAPRAYTEGTSFGSTLTTTTSDNTNITEPFDIQAAGGYRLLMQ